MKEVMQQKDFIWNQSLYDSNVTLIMFTLDLVNCHNNPDLSTTEIKAKWRKTHCLTSIHQPVGKLHQTNPKRSAFSAAGIVHAQ